MFKFPLMIYDNNSSKFPLAYLRNSGSSISSLNISCILKQEEKEWCDRRVGGGVWCIGVCLCVYITSFSQSDPNKKDFLF